MGRASKLKKERKAQGKAGKSGSGTTASKQSGAKRKALLWGLPLAGLGAAAVAYFVADHKAAAGISLFIGIGGWMVVYLSALGESIPQKDASASAAIEFGRTRN